MAQDNRPRPAFEAGAEEELERIRRALDESRQRRREANEAFDAFLRSFGPRSGREPRPVDPRSSDVRSVEVPSPPPVGPPSPPVSAHQLISAPPSVVESRSPIAEPPPIAKAAEPPADEPRPSVSASPIAEPRPVDRAVSPALTPWPPPENASRQSVDTMPPPAPDTPLPVRASESTASDVPPIVPSQSVSAPVVSVPDLPPVAPPVVDARSDSAGSDTGESWIPEPTTPLRLIQDDGTLESLIAEPSQISGPAATGSRSLYPVIPAGLRQSLQRGGLRREHLAAAGIILVVVVVLLIWGLSSTPDEGESAQRTAQPSTAPVASSQPSPPSAPPVSGLQVELRTIRHVWVRVVVDGEKTLEREVPADERIPINGQKAVVIRAGDAGAVRVAVNGQDQGPFGTDGFPATRTFTLPR